MTANLSREFLEEVWSVAKKTLPGWAFAALVNESKARAGGRAAHRVDDPSPIEKIALAEMRPRIIRGLSDDDLTMAWLRLHQWYSNFKRRKQPIEDIVNAGLWVSDEMKRRGMAVAPSDLTAELENFRESSAARAIDAKLKSLPRDVVLVRDFVSVVGSMAKGELEPGDLDVMVRAPWDREAGEIKILSENVWLPIRNQLDPDKRGDVHYFSNVQGAHGDFIPLYDLILRRRESIETQVVKDGDGAVDDVEKAFGPGVNFVPPKPLMAGFTEMFSVDEIWNWAKSRLPVDVEPKYNGFRGIAFRKGDEVGLWFEGQVGTNLAGKLPGVEQALRKIPGDFVLDLDVGIERGGKRVPRVDLSPLNSDKPILKPGEEIVLTAFDVPYFDEDLTAVPFADRREILESKVKPYLAVSPLRWVDSIEQLKAAAKWAFGFDRSEGLVSKTARGRYETQRGGTNEWAKLKRIAELKVIVLRVEEKENGARSYVGGLLPGESDWANLEELKGQRYVNLGASFNTDLQAKLGDILTVEVMELFPNEEKKTLTWIAARVIDKDPTRSTPYFAQQAVDIARRASVLQKAIRVVPTSGPRGAVVAFVGASPGRVEVARGEPFVGPTWETFEEKYLKSMELTRGEVVLTSAVPELLIDEAGKVREPNDEEISKWRSWLIGELDRLRPEVVVALGQSAKKALGDRADFVLPHPMAVQRFGDSGEVGRKTKQIRARLADIQKQEGDGEGETRGDVALRSWEETWQDRFPKSGKGRFVYQHHWRGLNKDEVNLSDAALMNTGHSIHGDLRFEGDDGLWGFAVFLGTTEDNKRAGGDRLFPMTSKENLRLAPKLLQPKPWLKVGTQPKGQVVEPGGVGATTQAFSKFFGMDEGTYQVGVVTDHAIEIFLDGKRLLGRYLITYPRLSGERVWLIDKPESQVPRAETEKLADLISDQKRKGRRFVIWAKPGTAPVTYDVRTGEVVKSEIAVSITKADPVKRIVYGVVIDPYGPDGPRPDAHNDWIPPSAVEQTAHDFLKGPRTVGMQHRTKANAAVVESWVEAYPSRTEYLKAMKGEPHKVSRRKFGSDDLHSGAWVLGVELGEDEWEAYKRGEINAFSPGGVGFRSPMTPAMMPKVAFVDLISQES